MNFSFVTISTLVKSNLTEKCFINVLMNISSQSLRSYLKLASICDGNSIKKKRIQLKRLYMDVLLIN